MPEKNIKTLAEFDQEVINGELPSLVDFWAPWCGPCQMISPIVAEISQEYEGIINVIKINIDEAKDLAAKYGIMSIPNLLFFKNGKQVNQKIGSIEKEALKESIDRELL